MDSFAAGAIAGVSEILTMYPLDVVKTRSQLSVGKGEGMISSFSNIIKNEGFSRLYRGISVSTFGSVAGYSADSVKRPRY